MFCLFDWMNYRVGCDGKAIWPVLGGGKFYGRRANLGKLIIVSLMLASTRPQRNSAKSLIQINLRPLCNFFFFFGSLGSFMGTARIMDYFFGQMNSSLFGQRFHNGERRSSVTIRGSSCSWELYRSLQNILKRSDWWKSFSQRLAFLPRTCDDGSLTHNALGHVYKNLSLSRVNRHEHFLITIFITRRYAHILLFPCTSTHTTVDFREYPWELL